MYSNKRWGTFRSHFVMGFRFKIFSSRDFFAIGTLSFSIV